MVQSYLFVIGFRQELCLPIIFAIIKQFLCLVYY